jgi:hypothetical protein
MGLRSVDKPPKGTTDLSEIKSQITLIWKVLEEANLVREKKAVFNSSQVNDKIESLEDSVCKILTYM